MSAFKETLKQTLPPGVVQVLKDSYDGMKRAKDWPAATFHPLRQISKQRISELKDRHKGQRCFVIGNGPSLRQTDLSRLRNEFTIGVNRFYLAFPELGFETSYYLTVNDLVIEQCVADLARLRMPCFFSWRSRKYIDLAENARFLYTTYTGPKFATDVSGRVWEGGTVTYVALQVAYHLGFDEVILIGVDHSYATSGTPNATVTSQGDDPNHFHPGYFGKGYRWQLPDLIAWEDAYRLARRTYESTGRKVVDATVGGKLQVFPKVDYTSLFV